MNECFVNERNKINHFVFLWLFTHQNIFDYAVKGLILGKNHISHDMWISFLKTMVLKHIDSFLSGLNRDERAELMNCLFPKIFKEFPLTDLDILSTFSTSGNDIPSAGFENP